MKNLKALAVLTTDEEMAETLAIGKIVAPIRLQYLRGSRQRGLRLWNVLSPQLQGYGPNGGLNGYPTFSIEGLKSKGLV